MATIDLAAFATQMQEQADAKRVQQDKLLADLQQEQAVNSGMRPMAQLIDFMSGINPRQKGFNLSSTVPSAERDQQVKAGIIEQMKPNYDDIYKALAAQNKNTNMPASVEEYRYAVANDGYQGSYTDWVKQKQERPLSPNVGVPTSKEIGDQLGGIVKDAGKYSQQITAAEKLLESGDQLGYTQAASMIARLLGETGALTTYDVTSKMPQTLATKINSAIAYVSSNPNQPLPKDLADAVKSNIKLVKGAMRDAFQSRMDLASEGYKNEPLYKDYFLPGRIGHVYQNKMKSLFNAPASAQAGTTLKATKKFNPATGKLEAI